MKLQVFLAAAITMCVAAAAFAQKVTITPAERVYTRPKPSSDYKKTFKVVSPIVKAASPALSRKITAAINPLTVLDININEELSEYQWLEEAGFEEKFNDRGLLVVLLWMEGSSAYPSGVSKYVVVNTANGDRVTPADVFTDLPKLAAAGRVKQLKGLEEAKVEWKKDPEMTEEQMLELTSRTKFTVEDLSHFSVDAEGVTFHFAYNFPHVIRALEPDGTFLFSWSEIKPFIKPNGLLARFVR